VTGDGRIERTVRGPVLEQVDERLGDMSRLLVEDVLDRLVGYSFRKHGVTSPPVWINATRYPALPLGRPRI
jgi:hypothetical protein